MKVKITIESEGKATVWHEYTYLDKKDLPSLIIAVAQGVMTTVKHMFSGENYPTGPICTCKEKI